MSWTCNKQKSTENLTCAQAAQIIIGRNGFWETATQSLPSATQYLFCIALLRHTFVTVNYALFWPGGMWMSALHWTWEAAHHFWCAPDWFIMTHVLSLESQSSYQKVSSSFLRQKFWSTRLLAYGGVWVWPWGGTFCEYGFWKLNSSHQGPHIWGHIPMPWTWTRGASVALSLFMLKLSLTRPWLWERGCSGISASTLTISMAWHKIPHISDKGKAAPSIDLDLARFGPRPPLF